jgi:hypothetical protein
MISVPWWWGARQLSKRWLFTANWRGWLPEKILLNLVAKATDHVGLMSFRRRCLSFVLSDCGWLWMYLRMAWLYRLRPTAGLQNHSVLRESDTHILNYDTGIQKNWIYRRCQGKWIQVLKVHETKKFLESSHIPCLLIFLICTNIIIQYTRKLKAEVIFSKLYRKYEILPVK